MKLHFEHVILGGGGGGSYKFHDQVSYSHISVSSWCIIMTDAYKRKRILCVERLILTWQASSNGKWICRLLRTSFDHHPRSPNELIVFSSDELKFQMPTE